MARLALFRLAAISFLLSSLVHGQTTDAPPALDTTAKASPAKPAEPAPPPIVLDVVAGRIFGATIGMDELTTRNVLLESDIVDLKKLEYPNNPEYPHSFCLQSPSCAGVSFFFRGGQVLDEIYTNSPNVRLSNGLKKGDAIAKFTEKLGSPKHPERLPNGVDYQVVYPFASFELAVICRYAEPDVSVALLLRKARPH